MYTAKELQKIINTEIATLSGDLKKKNPVDLYLPVEYSIDMGGKRLRPVLLLLSYNLFIDDVRNAVPAALAIEVFHNFTLLHDDIMDNADVRRNQPTVHKKFSENAAILSGDVMAFLSYEFLFQCKSEKLVDAMKLFTKTAIEVCEGQQLDMDFETRTNVTESEYVEMIKLKTAVLLACGLKAGALLANASEEVANQLYEYGLNLGLAFQLQDDMLDSFGNQKTFGKRIGGDILANKKTFLLIKALENAPEELKSELLDWLGKTEYDDEEKIGSVLKIYRQLHIKELVNQKIDYYFQKSIQIYHEIMVDENKKQTLHLFCNNMMNRVK